jgi:hypothetical protein
MSTGYQSNNAQGTRFSELRASKCRHTITLETTLFETIRVAAVKKNRSISEEMVARLAASVKESGAPQ